MSRLSKPTGWAFPGVWARKLRPEVRMGWLIPGMAGIRAQQETESYVGSKVEGARMRIAPRVWG